SECIHISASHGENGITILLCSYMDSNPRFSGRDPDVVPGPSTRAFLISVGSAGILDYYLAHGANFVDHSGGGLARAGTPARGKDEKRPSPQCNPPRRIRLLEIWPCDYWLCGAGQAADRGFALDAGHPHSHRRNRQL